MAIDFNDLATEADRLRNELSEIEENLEKLIKNKDIIESRLKAIKLICDAYGFNLNNTQNQDVGQRQDELVQNNESIPEFSDVRPRTSEILRAAWQEIQTRGEPVPTRTLVEALESRGIPIGGQNKVASLSAALSHSQHFRNVGRNVGWKIQHDPAVDNNH